MVFKNSFLYSLVFYLVFTFRSSLFAVEFKHQLGFFGGFGFHSISSQSWNMGEKFFYGYFPSGGFFYNFSHLRFARIQVELLYSRKGAQLGFYEAALDSISLPILFRFQDYSGFFFKFGFAPSWIVNGYIKDDLYSKKKIVFEEDIKKLTHDLIFSLGSRFEIAKWAWIFFESRITYTLNNINFIFDDSKNLHPLNWDISLGFEFLDTEKQKTKNSKKKN